MIKYILMITLLFQYAIGQWNKTNWPVDDPSDIFFKDSLSGLIIGYGPPSITNDGGKYWFTPEQEDVRFYSSLLYFKKDSLGFGFGGYIHRTKDMGYTWKDISPNGYDSYSDIFFLDDSTGYVVGQNGEIYHT